MVEQLGIVPTAAQEGIVYFLESFGKVRLKERMRHFPDGFVRRSAI